MAIVLLKLAAFTALCYYFSKACFNNCGLNKDNYFSQDFILNTVTGICSHLLLTHLLSYITQNVTTSIYLSLSILVSTSVVLTIKNKIAWTKIFNQVDLFDLGCIGISGLLASFYKIRYELFGDSARFHLALVGSISNNNIYPPVYPSNHDLPMPFYHYGLDFSLTNLKTITGLSTIEIFPIHTGFTCFLGLVAVFVFFRYFIKSPIYSFLATFFYLTISHTSIEFLTREIFNITSPDFIKSWKSTLGLYGASGLGDGRGGLYFMLSFTFLLIIISVVSGLQTSSRMKLINLIPITAISFMLFMFKNALWSMTFAATLISLTLILINKVFINKEKTFRFIINSAILVISVYLGKILSFSNPLSMGFNGIDPVTWAPSLKWVMHSFGYLSYFYDNEYMNNVATVTDLSQAAQRPLNLFFSTLSMRKFGYVFIPAILLFIYQVSQKQINKSSLIFFITCVSLPVPFLLYFEPKPFETQRFLSFVTLYSILYVVINLSLLIKEKLANSKVLLSLILILCLILSVPGVIAMLPTTKFSKGVGSYWLPDSALIKALEQVHQTGDIILDTQFLHLGHHISELAGFYGVGGQMYKAEMRTRWTAMQLINPLLLSELKVNYLLQGPSSQISPVGKKRLKDPNLFQEIESIHQAAPQYRLYKFIGAKATQALSPETKVKLQAEYHWVIGYTNGEFNFIPLNIKGSIISSNTKAELQNKTIEVRELLLKQNKAVALFTVIEALPRKT